MSKILIHLLISSCLVSISGTICYYCNKYNIKLDIIHYWLIGLITGCIANAINSIGFQGDKK